MLFIYWVGCCAIAILLVIINIAMVHKHSKTQSLQNASSSVRKDTVGITSDQSQPATNDLHPSMVPESHSRDSVVQVSTKARKLFHLLVLLIFLPGIMLDPVMMCAAATCGLVAFIIIEVSGTVYCKFINVCGD